jgi:hypothetical protein
VLSVVQVVLVQAAQSISKALMVLLPTIQVASAVLVSLAVVLATLVPVPAALQVVHPVPVVQVGMVVAVPVPVV